MWPPRWSWRGTSRRSPSITAGLADQRRRTAQHQAEYRQRIDSLKSAISDLFARRFLGLLAPDELPLQGGGAGAASLDLRGERGVEAHDRLVAELRREIAEKDVALGAADRPVASNDTDAAS